MIDAELLATYQVPPTGTAPTLTLYSVWVPRGGDNVMVTLEAVSNLGSVLNVQLVQKNRSEVGDGSVVTGTVKFPGTTGRKTQVWLGVKEQIRFKFTLDPTSVSVGKCGLVLFRFLKPSWFETVKA